MSDLFYKLEVNDSKIKIYYTEKYKIDLEKKNFEKLNNNIDRLKYSGVLENKFLNKIYRLDEISLNNEMIYVWAIFDINFKDSVLIRGHYINNKLVLYLLNSKLEKICDLPGNKYKYDLIIQNMVDKYLYDAMKKMKYCDRQIFLKEYYLTYISYFFDLLNDGGNVQISMLSFCDNYTINMLYILASMFEYIIIYDTSYIYCNNFRGNKSQVTKEDLEKCIKSKSFSINKKDNYEDLLKYIYTSYKNKIEKINLFLNKKYDEYIDIKISEMYNYLKYIKKDNNIVSFFYKKILNICKRSVINNKVLRIHSSIKELEGNYIIDVIKKNNYKKCLEIGMAFGVSAFYILLLNDTTLLSIDPNQKTEWNNNGIKLLKEFGLDKRHKCIEDKSYNALPDLLKKNNLYDFIFIDGWHTFDYTLIDFFYADKLLKIGGSIIIDDALHKGVSKTINYINSNYTHYKKVNSPITVASYIKMSDDKRPWDYHINF